MRPHIISLPVSYPTSEIYCTNSSCCVLIGSPGFHYLPTPAYESGIPMLPFSEIPLIYSFRKHVWIVRNYEIRGGIFQGIGCVPGYSMCAVGNFISVVSVWFPLYIIKVKMPFPARSFSSRPTAPFRNRFARSFPRRELQDFV